MLVILFSLFFQNAYSWSLDYSWPEYKHEWNWNVGYQEEAFYGNCRGANPVVNKWRSKEKNAGDFWQSYITCKDMKTNGTLENDSLRVDFFEYSGNGSWVISEVSSDKVPVGVKLKYKKWNGTKKVVDYTLIHLPIEKIGQCATSGYNSGWATNRNSANHEVVTLFCNCGAMTGLDIIKKKPNLSAPEITGVRVNCRLIERD